MLTPIEIQNKTLKAGMGYKKSDVDALIAELYVDYEQLYRKNAEQREKMKVLSEGIQYYKKIEKTIQGALLLAEQASSETKRTAEEQARAILDRANRQAEELVAQANQNLEDVKQLTRQLIKEYERYRLNIKHTIQAELEMMEGEEENAHRFSASLTKLMETEPQMLEPRQNTLGATDSRETAESPANPANASARVRRKNAGRADARTSNATAESESQREYSMAELDALRAEGKQVAAHIDKLEETSLNQDQVPEMNTQNTPQQDKNPEDLAQEREAFAFLTAATKDLTKESQAVKEILQQMEERENLGMDADDAGASFEDNPFEFLDPEDFEEQE